MPPRAYSLGRRGPVTAATRTRILEAARALVGGPGDLGELSMDSVAERAGVSRMTVYNQFESRTGLLDALADHLAARGGMARLREVFAEPNVDVALRRFVEVFSGFWASDRTTLRRMRALGVLFPSRHRGLPARDAWRLQAAANLVERHAASLALRSERQRRQAAELLSALSGFEFFDAIRTGGRTPAQASALIGGLAVQMLRTTRGGVPGAARGGQRAEPAHTPPVPPSVPRVETRGRTRVGGDRLP